MSPLSRSHLGERTWRISYNCHARRACLEHELLSHTLTSRPLLQRSLASPPFSSQNIIFSKHRRYLNNHPSIPSNRHFTTKASAEATSTKEKGVVVEKAGHKHGTTLLTGSLMGLFGGVAGLGGGVVCIPMLTGLANFTQHQAHGTSLVAVAATGLVGALSYYQNGGGLETVNVESAIILATFASGTSYLGAVTSKKIHAKGMKLILGLFMIVASVLIYNRREGGEQQLQEEGEVKMRKKELNDALSKLTSPTFLQRELPFWGCLGTLTGFFAGLLGVGGGVIMMPLLSLFGDMNQQTALATSLLAMVVPSSIGARTHYKLGHVVTWSLPSLLVGTSVGAYLGGFFSTSLTTDQQRLVVSCILGLLGGNTIWRYKMSR
jgi:uncharacterized membrane protein YfcA